MIKHESDTVDGTVIYCDECGKRGPWTAYDNVDDTIDCAEQSGWTQSDDGDHDLCKECTANAESGSADVP